MIKKAYILQDFLVIRRQNESNSQILCRSDCNYYCFYHGLYSDAKM